MPLRLNFVCHKIYRSIQFPLIYKSVSSNFRLKGFLFFFLNILTRFTRTINGKLITNQIVRLVDANEARDRVLVKVIHQIVDQIACDSLFFQSRICDKYAAEKHAKRKHHSLQKKFS